MSDQTKSENGNGRVRVNRSISFRPDQDLWLAQTFGERGNVSGFFQAVVDAAMDGKLDFRAFLQSQKDVAPLARAEAYLRAKEAGMLFEEDVGACVTKWLAGKRGVSVSRGRIHNGSGSTFIADFSLEREGAVLCSIECKSSPRADRLQLALAEAMIGAAKTSRPVITVVPYLVEESAETAKQFELLGYALATLADLPAALDRVVKSSK